MVLLPSIVFLPSLFRGSLHTHAVYPYIHMLTAYKHDSLSSTGTIAVSCSTQILYPHPPAAVWATAKPAARAAFEALPLSRMTEDERDARLEMVIEAVELDYLLGRSGPLLLVVQQCGGDHDANTLAQRMHCPPAATCQLQPGKDTALVHAAGLQKTCCLYLHVMPAVTVKHAC